MAKKTILELYFHKYLIYKNTTIIILFTYSIAVLIPFLTGQLKITNLSDVFLVSIISSAFIVFIVIFLNEFNYHLKKIPEEIKKLE